MTLLSRFPTLTALFDGLTSGALADADWSDLPTYGGIAPADTLNVWSWNATHLIVGTCGADLELVAR